MGQNVIANRARALLDSMGLPSGDYPEGSDEDVLSAELAEVREIAESLIREVERLESLRQ